MKPWCLSQRTRLLIITLAYPHRMTFTLSSVLTFKGPVCMRQLYKRPFLFERYVTTHWHDLKHNPFTPPPTSILNCVCWTLCNHAYPCSADVNNILFVAFNFRERPFCLTDLRLFLSELAGFFVSFQEMKKAVLSPSINKHLCE